jgi:hypothetical protein
MKKHTMYNGDYFPRDWTVKREVAYLFSLLCCSGSKVFHERHADGQLELAGHGLLGRDTVRSYRSCDRQTSYITEHLYSFTVFDNAINR